jgi:hypothetical protein
MTPGRKGRERLAEYVATQRYSFSWGRYLLSTIACWLVMAGLVWVSALVVRSIAHGPIMYDDQATLALILTTSVEAALVAGLGVVIAPRAAFPRPKPWSPPVLGAAGGTLVWSLVAVGIFGPRQSPSGLFLWQVAIGAVLAVLVGVGTKLVKPPVDESLAS